MVGNLVILNRDSIEESYLLAVDSRTGKTVWKHTQTGKANNYSTPVVLGDCVVLHRFSEIAAHAISDGTRIWTVSVASYGTSTPVIGDDTIFAGACRPDGEPVELPMPPDFKTLATSERA